MPLLPRSRRGSWLLAGAIALASCDVAWIAFSNRPPPPAVRTVSINELLTWLDLQPPLDSSKSIPKLTWNEWVTVGRSIPDLEERLLPLLETGSNITKFRIAYALETEFGTTKSARALIRALQDEDPGIQVHCAAALGRIGDESAVDALIAAAQSPHINVQINAFVSLGKIGGPAAEKFVKSALTDDDPRVRSSAMEASALQRNRSR